MIIRTVCFFCLTILALNLQGQAIDSLVLDASEFKARHDRHPEWQLVDVRTGAEFGKGHIRNALNLDVNGDEFKSQVSALDKSTPVLIYCMSGGRSAKAASWLRSEGFTKVYELKGGMLQWKAQNQPYESMAPAIPGITVNAYEKEIRSQKLVLVDFYAKWCAPCVKMAPEMNALLDQYPGKFRLVKINVDENETVVKKLRIDALPVLILYKDGVVVWSTKGLIDKKELENVLLRYF
jgi:thioredoxin 1